MNQRWQRGESPFSGDCLRSNDLLSVEELLELLTIVVSELQTQHVVQVLYTFDDWHQHDGYVTERTKTEWSDLLVVTGSAKALIASRQGDTYVHRSFYPEDFAFLLRYDLSDEDHADGDSFTGTFDISASSTMIRMLISIIPESLRSRFVIRSSKEYFDMTYAG